MSAAPLTVLLARVRGFCAGVERAIAAVDQTLVANGGQTHVRHEIVHNPRVVDRLARNGARFVDDLAEVPEGAVVVFSAHGVAAAVEQEAERRGLRVVDATCPLVRRVHHEARRHARAGREVLVIGHRDHVEVEGTLGRIEGAAQVVETVEEARTLVPIDPERVAFVVQTTLSVDDARAVIAALRQRFPAIVGPDTRTICYATQNRQTAVRELARRARHIIVCGARNSSNSNRLRELAQALGTEAVLVEQANELDPAFLDGVARVGLTAGASTPEAVVRETLERMAGWRSLAVEEVGESEAGARFAPVDLGAIARGPGA
jgi:4-hydroxy-3-methylbut-2-enyl diphosphate reductase